MWATIYAHRSNYSLKWRVLDDILLTSWKTHSCTPRQTSWHNSVVTCWPTDYCLTRGNQSVLCQCIICIFYFLYFPIFPQSSPWETHKLCTFQWQCRLNIFCLLRIYYKITHCNLNSKIVLLKNLFISYLYVIEKKLKKTLFL